MHVLICVFLLHLIQSNACCGWGGVVEVVKGFGTTPPPVRSIHIVKKVSILKEINLITVIVLTLKISILFITGSLRCSEQRRVHYSKHN